MIDTFRDGSSNDSNDDTLADNQSSVVRLGEARSNLIVFTDDGQLYTCNIKGVKVRVAGNKGTLVSTDNGMLVVHRGSVCLAPTQTMTAHTRFGSVEIPGGSSVALAVSSKSARIGAMASTKPATVFLKNASQGMQLAAGKALLITASQVAEQSLYGDDDAASTTAATTVTQPTPATTSAQPAPATNGNMLTGGVSKQVQAAAQPKSRGRVLHIIGSADTRFHIDDDGNLILQHGSMFVEASGNMTVKSSRGAVELKPGALVHIDSRDGLMSVKACSGPGDIKVSRPAFNQALAPGQELLLSAHRPTKNDMTPADGIGRRKQDVKELSDGTHAVISDFAMITLIGNLTNLRKSTSAVDKKIVDRLLRTAAAVGIATSGRGVYTSKPKPKPAFKADATESAKRTPFKPVAYSGES